MKCYKCPERQQPSGAGSNNLFGDEELKFQGKHFHGDKLLRFLAREGKIKIKRRFGEGQVKKEIFL